MRSSLLLYRIVRSLQLLFPFIGYSQTFPALLWQKRLTATRSALLTVAMLTINLLAQAQVSYLSTYTDGKVAGLPTQPIVDNRGNGRVNSVPSPMGGTIGFSNELGNGASPSGLSWGYGYSGKVYSNNQVTSITLTLPANTKAFYLLARANYQPNLSGMGGGNITASATTEKGYTTSGTQRCYFADTEAKYIAFNIDNYVIEEKTVRVCDNPTVEPCYDQKVITSYSNISDYLKTITVTLDFPGATLYIGQFGIYQCENNQFTTSLLASDNGVLTCTNPTLKLTAPDVDFLFTGISFAGPNGPVTDNEFIRVNNRVTVSEPGTYTVTADPDAGCRRTGTVTVTEDKAIPTNVTLSNDGPLSCKKTSVTLTAGSANGVNYAFSGPNGFSRSGTDVTASATTPGKYALVVTGSNGCTTTVQTDVGTAPAPTADVTQSLTDLYNATGGPNWTHKDNWLSGCTPCGWYGVTCDDNGRVTKLNLTGNNLVGTLPTSLLVITSLQSLELGANTLTGGIPTGIGNLTALQTLNLSRTQLGGPIPVSLGGLTRLQNLLLNESALNGSLPASLGMLTQLQNLQLYANQLGGCFPASYTALCGRSSISFANNPSLPGGGDFGAFCSNGTGGSLVVSQFPQSGTACVGSAFSFSVTARGATSYQWYKEGQRLAESGPVLRFSGVNASNAGTYQVYINYACGAIQSDFVTLTVGSSSPDYQPLADLYTSTNGPGWTNKANWLTTCDVCSWQGVTCTSGRVTGIDLTGNNLVGTLPVSLSGLTSLQSLLLGTNQLTGSIPASLGTLPALQTLILFQNSLTGSIPASLGSRTGLQVLNLSANQLEGAIPDQLGALTQLRVLNLSNNRLLGTLPASLSALTGVQAFDLSRNQLTGSIPAGYGALQNTIILNINNNQLSGCFPTSLTALCAYGPVIERIAMPGGPSGARQLAMGGGINEKVNVTGNAGLPGGGDFDSFCAFDAGRCNTAPVATANISQTANVGSAFSYTVSAFTDTETPDGLTYTALFSPASSGLRFEATTRVISGTPSEPGPISVTITATDGGGLSASTSFTIGVGPRLVSSTPLRVTLTASPQTLLTSGSTLLRASASGGTPSAPSGGYIYRFIGPGDFATSQANEVTVTNLPAGVQTFTVVVTDAGTPTSQTISATISVTVTQANTAPTVVSTIPSQSATVDQAFSYVIPASTFTDAQTPNSLSLSASGLPQGLRFTAPATISGTPSASGTSTVTVTATDPGSLSASTSFVLTVRPAPVVVTPLVLTLAASPATLPVSGSTTLSATVSGGTAPYRYSFTGPGTITQSSNTARVASLPAGVQTFTVVVSDAAQPTGQSITKMVSVTVSAPAATTALRVLHQDADNNLTNNAIKPNLQISNTGTAPISYGQLTLRYWLTVEQFSPLANLQVYYAQLGTDKVKMSYVALDKPRQGAFGYVEYRFDGSAGSLAAGASSGPIQSGIAKQDYTAFNEADDYSFASNQALTANSRVTAYLNGQLVWGTEPAEVASQRIVKAYTENKNGASTNTIGTFLQVRNEGNMALSYSELKVRYYFTSEGSQPLNFYLDYAVLGNQKVRGQFGRLNPPLASADTYLELSFDASLGTFNPGSSTGNIQYRIAKQDWSSFSQSNDYSYQNATSPLAENGRVVVYVGGQRVYGTEPGAGGRVAAEEVHTPFTVTVQGNPVRGNNLRVQITGSGGEPLRMQLVNAQGVVVTQQQLATPQVVEQHDLSLQGQGPGLFLLQVSTPTQSRTVRVLKAD
ncbi:cellulose binding domain-containing protein [Fibrella sp. ES10-3-2-2]|nr:hypothetical protein A6C57_22330 [Fibrella sp. ES10-3-2-2]